MFLLGNVQEAREYLTDRALQFLDVMVPQSIFEKAGNNKSGAAVLVWVKQLDKDPDITITNYIRRFMAEVTRLEASPALATPPASSHAACTTKNKVSST